MSNTNYRLVMVTAPDHAVARTIAQSALELRLIACANIVPGIESIYHWEGKIETGNEVLLLLKTEQSLLLELEKNVLQNHPYDTPEFVVLEIAGGNERYLKWLGASVSSGSKL